ncbi:Uncharacterized protein TCM_021745 [Theobroma cacao]|uniref:Uncharacterized protein n=1 Tax=Theobroma cacao TaxID=3641 RepID=A0A061ERK1_THECC|nr:Uncharacterized protein TCM_021745 [Theobroma cacao]
MLIMIKGKEGIIKAKTSTEKMRSSMEIMNQESKNVTAEDHRKKKIVFPMCYNCRFASGKARNKPDRSTKLMSYRA